MSGRGELLSSNWILVFVALAAIGLLAGQALLVGLATLVLLAWGLAWGWNRLALARVTYHRSLSQSRAFPGETVQLRLQVANRKTLPLPWVQVTDQAPPELWRDGSQARPVDLGRVQVTHSTSLSWFEQVSWTAPLHCTRRGFYRFGPATIASGDIFGFFRSERELPGLDHLLVYPRVVPLPELGLPAGRPFGEVRGGDPVYEDPTRLKGLREYQQDDPWKRIDWKATARRDQLQVRVYEPTQSHALLVLLNASTTVGMGRWGYADAILERAVTVAASVASHAFEERYSVGLMTNAHSLLSQAPIKIPPSRTPQQMSTLLEALAVVGPMSSSSMEEMLWSQVHQLPLGAVLVVVTAILPLPLLDTLLDLRRRGHRLYILWVGEAPMAEALGGGIRVYDVGRQVGRLLVQAAQRDGV